MTAELDWNVAGDAELARVNWNKATRAAEWMILTTGSSRFSRMESCW